MYQLIKLINLKKIVMSIGKAIHEAKKNLYYLPCGERVKIYQVFCSSNVIVRSKKDGFKSVKIGDLKKVY